MRAAFVLRVAFAPPARLLAGILVCMLVSIPGLHCGAARGAEIITMPLSDADSAVILLTGEIEISDGERFRQATARYPKAAVILGSLGGNLFAALEIGTQIRMRNYATAVLGGSVCTSACAIAWLGGTRRFIATGAMIGFHAAYTGHGDQAKESGQANAVLGAYLTTLGLPFQAVAFITKAPPDGMSWLTPAIADREGIDVSSPDVLDKAPSRTQLEPLLKALLEPAKPAPPLSPPSSASSPAIRYVVDGLALGDKVRFDSAEHSTYRCGPSEKFPDFIWCHRKQQGSVNGKDILTSNSILHDRAGVAWYINRYMEPAFFGPGHMMQEIDRLSAVFGHRPRLCWMPERNQHPQLPQVSGDNDSRQRRIEELERQNAETRLQLDNPLVQIFDPDSSAHASVEIAARNREIQKLRQQSGGGPGMKAVIAVWGEVALQQLSDAEVAAVAERRDFNGLLVSYLGDLEQSAKAGAPLYRLAGGAGFVWAASSDADGTGVLRFLASDTGRFSRNP